MFLEGFPTQNRSKSFKKSGLRPATFLFYSWTRGPIAFPLLHFSLINSISAELPKRPWKCSLGDGTQLINFGSPNQVCRHIASKSLNCIFRNLGFYIFKLSKKIKIKSDFDRLFTFRSKAQKRCIHLQRAWKRDRNRNPIDRDFILYRYVFSTLFSKIYSPISSFENV